MKNHKQPAIENKTKVLNIYQVQQITGMPKGGDGVKSQREKNSTNADTSALLGGDRFSVFIYLTIKNVKLPH